jgi:hypothetical protein
MRAEDPRWAGTALAETSIGTGSDLASGAQVAAQPQRDDDSAGCLRSILLQPSPMRLVQSRAVQGKGSFNEASNVTCREHQGGIRQKEGFLMSEKGK